MAEPFFMITVDSGNAPSKRYTEYVEAQTEAERLMHKEGRPAHILVQIATVTPPPGQWKHHTGILNQPRPYHHPLDQEN